MSKWVQSNLELDYDGQFTTNGFCDCCGLVDFSGFYRDEVSRRHMNGSYEFRPELDKEYKERINRLLPPMIARARRESYAVIMITLAELEDDYSELSGGPIKQNQTILVPTLKKLGFKPVFDGINPKSRNRIVVMVYSLSKNKYHVRKGKNVNSSRTTSRLLRRNTH